MKVAINIQHDEWDDDGGMHDPFVIDLDKLSAINPVVADQIRVSTLDAGIELPMMSGDIVELLVDDTVRVKEFPCEIIGSIAVWYSW